MFAVRRITPQTQGKIERWHLTMTNRVLLENYFLPGDLERQIGVFVDYYNSHRHDESLANLTPADVCRGRGAKVLKMREEIKKQTIQNAGCSTRPQPPKLKQKTNQSLRYENATAFRKDPGTLKGIRCVVDGGAADPTGQAPVPPTASSGTGVFLRT